jgi:hypothetical protein
MTRECGECNVCCTAMRVKELDKPAGVRCVHQTESGCGNYENRPSVCRAWYCMWVRDDGRVFDEAQRPDRIGVFFSATRIDHDTGRQTVNAHEVYSGAFDRPEARQAIEYLSRFAPVHLVAAPRHTGELTLNGQPPRDAA